ncbi:MAG: iron ABC transporter permease [Clostridiales bacterium]|jgi:iron complex transport system permease protein|nr:iron ABC transporter permease [Clostridiales bacterium]
MGHRSLYKFNIGLACFLIALAFFSYTIGVADISFTDAVRALFDTSALDGAHITILRGIRLPRVISCMVIGMGLSVAGSVFQALFKNQLAEPFILGISSGASLGAALAIIYSFDFYFYVFSGASIAAAVFSVITVIFILFAYKLVRHNTGTLLLIGSSISLFCSSITTLLISIHADKIKNITQWSIGSFSNAGWQKVYVTLPIIFIGVIIIFSFHRELNAISVGESEAKSFGVPVEKSTYILLLASSLIVAVAVASSGIIGFVGLIIPNAVRMVSGADFKKLLPTSALAGATLLLFCDTVGRVAFAPSEMPVGAVTALIGAPFFLYIILKRG